MIQYLGFPVSVCNGLTFDQASKQDNIHSPVGPHLPFLFLAVMATELDEKLTMRGHLRKKYEKKQVCYC